MKICKRRAAISLFLTIIFSLIAAVLDEAQAATRPSTTPRVTAQNISLFSAQAPGYFCYKGSKPPMLGTLPKNQLRAGQRFTPVSTAGTLRLIASLQRSLAVMDRRKQAGSKTYLLRQAQLRAAVATLQRLQALIQACANPGSNPQLPGDHNGPPPAAGAFGGNPGSLSPYREQLTPAEVDHLLNKVAFGGTAELRRIGISQGLTPLVNALVDGIDPVNSENILELDAGYWTYQGLYSPEDRPSVKQWTVWALQWGEFVRLLYSRNPFKEYMTFLLSGHFATNLNQINFAFNDASGEGLPEHLERLRRNALGNFLNLSQEMVTDRAMSVWLNNVDNHRETPNQNFAREFLELFTLGALDPITGAPNYDERSIVAATGYLSGFDGVWDTNPATGLDRFRVVYNEDLHDGTAYNIFPGVAGADRSGALDWMELPRHILSNHPGSPRFLGERLFAEMVYPNVPENVVAEVAADLKTTGFELKPVLKKLLGSQAMFSAAAYKPCVSSPVEMLSSLYRKLVHTPLGRDGQSGERSTWLLWSLVENFRSMGQLPFEPPSVFGWKGSCGINRAGSKASGEGWVSAQRVLNRDRACVDLMNHISYQDYDFTTLFPSMNITPQEAVQTLSQNLFGSPVAPDAEAVLVHFLVTDFDTSNQEHPRKFDLNDHWYVQRKIPRVICLLQGMLDNNLR